MKLESIYMGDHDVLKALTMFVDEKWDDGMYHLINIESIAEDGIRLEDFLKDHEKSPGSLPVDMMTEWPGGYNGWLVYVLYNDTEVCGMIAITDYQ